MNRHTEKMRRQPWQRTRRPRHWSPLGFYGAPVIVTARPPIPTRIPCVEDALAEYDELVELQAASTLTVNARNQHQE